MCQYSSWMAFRQTAPCSLGKAVGGGSGDGRGYRGPPEGDRPDDSGSGAAPMVRHSVHWPFLSRALFWNPARPCRPEASTDKPCMVAVPVDGWLATGSPMVSPCRGVSGAERVDDSELDARRPIPLAARRHWRPVFRLSTYMAHGYLHEFLSP
jgi:hypothetical protein